MSTAELGPRTRPSMVREPNCTDARALPTVRAIDVARPPGPRSGRAGGALARHAQRARRACRALRRRSRSMVARLRGGESAQRRRDARGMTEARARVGRAQPARPRRSVATQSRAVYAAVDSCLSGLSGDDRGPSSAAPMSCYQLRRGSGVLGSDDCAASAEGEPRRPGRGGPSLRRAALCTRPSTPAPRGCQEDCSRDDRAQAPAPTSCYPFGVDSGERVGRARRPGRRGPSLRRAALCTRPATVSQGCQEDCSRDDPRSDFTFGVDSGARRASPPARPRRSVATTEPRCVRGRRLVADFR